ncbi:hypothetical protein CMI38_07245 [Candidatus Pacearchaeota archaeon]|jgi:hypothetical protein|nr:hypothetical protein [Candidatus Pacearchaeota archaeon]|tara:strand:+ start:787 stop:1185 length:399 start_codon:yes stop_codon:yes gene_type:complete
MGGTGLQGITEIQEEFRVNGVNHRIVKIISERIGFPDSVSAEDFASEIDKYSLNDSSYCFDMTKTGLPSAAATGVLVKFHKNHESQRGDPLSVVINSGSKLDDMLGYTRLCNQFNVWFSVGNYKKAVSYRHV